MPTLSVFEDVPFAQKLEGSLLKIYKQDEHPKKMFLSYRVCLTEQGLPWISPVVPKIRQQLSQDPSLNYEYLPEMGMKSFIHASLNLLFGKYSSVIMENRAGGLHTVGDSGAFHLGAAFLKMWHQKSKEVHIISSQKEHHGQIFKDMGFTVHEHCFWNANKLCMDPSLIFSAVEDAPQDCICVLGNFGSFTMTKNQWMQFMSILKSKNIFPFFDVPSQGFFSGDLEEDTRFLQYFVHHRFEFFCSQFLSRNFGIYDEGVGVLVVVTVSNEVLLCVLSQMMSLARALWSNPPNTGARIVTSILNNSALRGEWKQSLSEMVENILLVKEKVKEKLRLLGTPGVWNHVTDQKGSHCYLGLSAQQLDYLIKKKHIYVSKDGCINLTCVNASNIDYIVESINEAVIFIRNSEQMSSESIHYWLE
ncbi:putative aspartate aminotransferase, cytoplasmic 2 [Sorex fumeus]|uniref:putative aspartate aminotransferase, cytoplasmic 2 n=1 Tax=Sorex fumeus TaxID=62283 RepID=UPI0024AD2997|nr:putative aspartate aminotransferase, cytoplasmic 2 [Sorex fumeus]